MKQSEALLISLCFSSIRVDNSSSNVSSSRFLSSALFEFEFSGIFSQENPDFERFCSCFAISCLIGFAVIFGVLNLRL